MKPLNRRIFFTLASVLAFGTLIPGRAADAPASVPCTYGFDGATLAATRRLTMAKDAAVAEPLRKLCADADKRLKGTLWVITEKTLVAPSGDKHDYVSLATYYWPDPAKPDHLPYIQRDGEPNPEKKDTDEPRLMGMISNVRVLSLAYYLTGYEPYAERAAKQIRVWFLEEATRMNPHLKHAQMIRGRNEGSAVGIIDARGLTEVIDGVALLQGSPAWTAEDRKQLQEWFREYLEWLITSPLGKKEAAALNNHGIWFDVQAACISQFVENEKRAREICETARTLRIAKQIEPDGSQPLELKRTLSMSYSLFNLEAMFRLARIANRVGVDLWNYRTDDGRGIRAALDWVIPYCTGEKQWEHKQIKENSGRGVISLLRQASVVYKEPAYERQISQLKGVDDEVKRLQLTFPPAK